MHATVPASTVEGRVAAPPSKSYTHRAIFAGAYGSGCEIHRPLLSADTRASIRQLMEETLERLEQLPSVERAAVGLGLPFQRPLNLGMQIQLPDGTMTQTAVSTIYVTPGYFETLRVPLLRGRDLTEQDGPEAAPVMVVNRAFVDRYMGGDVELGRRVGSSGAEREIVGVVGNVLQDPSGVGGTDDPLAHIPMVYLPAAQVDDSAYVLIRA